MAQDDESKGITTSRDFGRFQTDRAGTAKENEEENVHVADQLDRATEGDGHPEGFGIPGGMTDEIREADARRQENLPVGGEYVDPPPSFNPRDPNDDAPDDFDTYGSMNPPRHDRYAAEHTGIRPDRVVPSTPTNANPAFANYERVVQDRPGRADGADAEAVADVLGEDEVAEQSTRFERPQIPTAGEGGFVERQATDEATGATSPTGDPHNANGDEDTPGTFAEAKEIAASHGGVMRDNDAEEIPPMGEGSEPPWQTPVDEREDGGATAEPINPPDDAPAPRIQADVVGDETTAADHSVESAGDAELADGEEYVNQPAKSAVKEAWIEWAVASGANREEAEAMTKADLIETYGQE